MQNDVELRKRGCLFRILRAFCLLVLVFVLGVTALLLYFATRYVPADFDTEAAGGISYTPLVQVVPGPGIPRDLDVRHSNNNLDIVKYKGRVYLAFRTAPTHFASKKTRLIVVSTEDRQKWECEAEFALMQSDLREPRFLVYQGRLFLYFFRGGDNPLGFAPKHIYATHLNDEGGWQEPKPIYKPGFVVWRAKEHQGNAYMSVYHGAGIYTTDDRPAEVRLLVSTDGYHWQPISEKAQFTDISGEEAEFAFDADGNLVVTVRMEVKGAEVCTACADDISTWDCKFTREKYDSALMIQHEGDVYVIARRNVDGYYNKDASWLPDRLERAYYLVRYSLTRKRTALYKVDVEKKKLQALFDFPSRGDTAYAGAVQLDEHTWWVLNYSSDLEGPDWSWIAGQLAGSNIYATELRFGSTRSGGCAVNEED